MIEGSFDDIIHKAKEAAPDCAIVLTVFPRNGAWQYLPISLEILELEPSLAGEVWGRNIGEYVKGKDLGAR
jgi:hypothetical protein